MTRIVTLLTSIAPIILLSLAAGAAFGETIDLSGRVRNSSDQPVGEASIGLAGRPDLGTTSTSTGDFRLTGSLSTAAGVRRGVVGPSAFIAGDCLHIALAHAAPVRVAVYSTSGRRVSSYDGGVLSGGAHRIPLGGAVQSGGVYQVVVQHGGTQTVIQQILGAPGTAAGAPVAQTPGVNSAQALYRSVQSVVDTLVVSATGYQTARIALASYSRSGIEIVLASTTSGSRLDNITARCGDGMPPAVTGGSSGWASRYWDCCKPHCSWPENTTRLSANCGVDNSEIPCYIDRGNWKEGTRSGCESGGEAFTCYRHAPFAICEDLAYGFAAVPAGSYACGTCFQIDFDGGFRHGEPKPAHALVQGKTMIVIASNIGHDVSGGQFDLMIPGGGLGAFKEGCARQWGIDGTNEALVGKTYGGFTSTCQEQLGWDAAPGAIKGCVRTMCDNLFGNNPALRDLWEGCIWYVDWMHAVDNPTFTYKAIECPRELLDLYYSSFH